MGFSWDFGALLLVLDVWVGSWFMSALPAPCSAFHRAARALGGLLTVAVPTPSFQFPSPIIQSQLPSPDPVPAPSPISQSHLPVPSSQLPVPAMEPLLWCLPAFPAAALPHSTCAEKCTLLRYATLPTPQTQNSSKTQLRPLCVNEKMRMGRLRRHGDRRALGHIMLYCAAGAQPHGAAVGEQQWCPSGVGARRGLSAALGCAELSGELFCAPSLHLL